MSSHSQLFIPQLSVQLFCVYFHLHTDKIDKILKLCLHAVNAKGNMEKCDYETVGMWSDVGVFMSGGVM